MPTCGASARLLAAAMLVSLACSGTAAHAASAQLDDMTWPEVRDALRTGHTTAIIPVGGTEQNGPHMALGKHNFRVAVLSARIAGKLGNALVAPVMPYVPEGQISPPAGHMRFSGTISVPEDAFAAVLAGAARSLKQHGFLDIVLIGDSGNYQQRLKQVADRLNREWAGSPARAHHVGAYYEAASSGFAQALRSRGFSDRQIGTHAGLADTSLTMYLDAARVRPEQLRAASSPEPSSGVQGEPLQSSAALGQVGADLIIDRTVAAIRQATAGRKAATQQE
jgi:creatinine amidohydrolase/Fe(II)-dependent formamide hydrolase-like protein